ncbi:MAG: amino acid--tRNA ligase-related protein [Bacteriovoracaceae bacterium]
MRLKYQFTLVQAIRNYFNQAGFLDTLTPPMVENPGMETHIHPFEVFSKRTGKSSGRFLHTSPEFHMKELLSLKEEELNNIFTIAYCFREEPSSPAHRQQFLMLEWYRKNERYEKIMQDCENLIRYCHRFMKEKKAPVNPVYENFDPVRATVQEIMMEELGFDILEFLDTKDLQEKIQKDFKDVPLPSSDCAWDDYFFLLFLNKIEPLFKDIPFLLLYEFPAPLAALSTLKKSDPRVCERFEVYLKGVELCNCFNELTNPAVQKERFEQQNQDKKDIYSYELNSPETLFEALERGMPPCAGVALGVERLLMSLVKIDNPFYR